MTIELSQHPLLPIHVGTEDTGCALQVRTVQYLRFALYRLRGIVA